MQHYAYSFLLHVIITLLVESGVIFILARRVFRLGKNSLSNSQLWMAGICASSLTLPYVWFVFPWLIANFTVAIVVAEVFALIVETVFYKFFLRISWKRAAVFSLVANFASYSIGQVLHWLANR